MVAGVLDCQAGDMPGGSRRRSPERVVTYLKRSSLRIVIVASQRRNRERSFAVSKENRTPVPPTANLLTDPENFTPPVRKFFALGGCGRRGKMPIFAAAQVLKRYERFCSHRFRNGQRQAHERLLGGRRRRARRRGGRFVLPPDPPAAQFLQPFHDGHPRSAL